MNAASASKIINQRSNIATSWEAPCTNRNNLQPCSYFHPKLTSKNPPWTGTRRKGKTEDMGIFFTQITQKINFCPASISFFKRSQIKSFLFFLVFIQSTTICTYSGYLLFYLFKSFQLVKKLNWLRRDLGKIIKDTLWNSFTSWSFSIVIHSINLSQ